MKKQIKICIIITLILLIAFSFTGCNESPNTLCECIQNTGLGNIDEEQGDTSVAKYLPVYSIEIDGHKVKKSQMQITFNFDLYKPIKYEIDNITHEDIILQHSNSSKEEYDTASLKLGLISSMDDFIFDIDRDMDNYNILSQLEIGTYLYFYMDCPHSQYMECSHWQHIDYPSSHQDQTYTICSSCENGFRYYKVQFSGLKINWAEVKIITYDHIIVKDSTNATTVYKNKLSETIIYKDYTGEIVEINTEKYKIKYFATPVNPWDLIEQKAIS